MPSGGRSTRTIIGAVCVAVIAGAVFVLWRSGETPSPRSASLSPSTRDPDGAVVPSRPSSATAPETPGPPSTDGIDLRTLPDTPWAKVDLDAIREVMPDNTFWTMAMPTTDPTVEAARASIRERWNREWGKVQSNTATAEEIDAYYAERQRVAQDYVEFATYLLAEYGKHLTERDVGLLKVAIELNLARLERFPREIALAQERRVAHDAARRAWKEQERLFDDSRDR